MKNLSEFIEDAIESHNMIDGSQIRPSNAQLYLMVNTLITNQSVALQAELKEIRELIDQKGKRHMIG